MKELSEYEPSRSAVLSPVDVVADAGDEPGQQHQVQPVGLGVTAEAGAVAVRPAVPLPDEKSGSEPELHPAHIVGQSRA